MVTVLHLNSKLIGSTNRKVITVILLVLFCSALFSSVILVPSVSASAPSMPGWSHYKQLSIANSSQAGGNAVLSLVTYYGSGTDGNASFYLGGLCNTDFSDVRLVTQGGNLLPIYNQTCYVSDNATWWFKLTSNIFAFSNSIYLFYGNPTATSISNETTVFKSVVSSMAAVYPFNEGSGTSVRDLVNTSNGTAYNLTSSWVAGKYDYALDFSYNTSRFVEIPNAANLTPTSALSVEAWVKPTSIGDDRQIVFKNNGTTSGGAYSMRITSTGNVTFIVQNASGTVGSITSTATINLNQWNHLVGIYNGSHINVYVNNVAGTPVAQTGNVQSTTGNLFIGVRDLAANGKDRPFNGTIDEVHIYGVALSTAQINLLYNYYADGFIDSGKILIRNALTTQPTITQSTTTPNTLSIIQISDTQYLTSNPTTGYSQLCNWITNKSQDLNLQMVVHTGDIVDNGSTTAYWDVANSAMMQFYNSSIPYCWDAGNHDQLPFANSSGTWIGNQYQAFNDTLFSQKSYYESSLFQGKNTATRFTYNGYSFLIINIEYWGNSSTITWMYNLIGTHPTDNVIVTSHSILNATAQYPWSWEQTLKAEMDTKPKIFMSLSGHDNAYAIGANNTVSGTREDVFFDFQTSDYPDGAATARIYTINLDTDKVATSTYQVYNDTWLTDSYNQFTFDLAGLTPDPTPTPTNSPNPTQRIGSSLIGNLALFGILPIAVGAMVFFVALKSFGQSGENTSEVVLPALFSAIIITVMVEICVYVAVFVVNAMG